MGYPMAPDEPAVQDALERVRRACADAEIPVGEMVSDLESVERVLEDGARIIRLGDDVRAVRETVAAQFDVVRDYTE
jgi:2-dehydro-3-deoxyglucarate aldolase